MHKHSMLLLAAAVFAFSGGSAMAQYYNRPTADQWAAWHNMQPRGAVVNDCTDYGYGDCTERAQRQVYGGGMGYGPRPYYGGYYRPMVPVARPIPMYGWRPVAPPVIVIQRVIVVPGYGY